MLELTTDLARVRAARLAAIGYFCVTGIVQATWASNVPWVKHRLGLNSGALGLVLLVMAIGALIGMQATGRLVRRFGSRAITRVSGGLTGLLLAGPGLAATVPVLTITLFLFGLGAGALQVASNAQAISIERGYRRPVISGFHAAYSIGGVIGGVIGFLTVHVGISGRFDLLTAGILASSAFLAAGCWLLPVPREQEQPERPTVTVERGYRPAIAWLLGMIAAAGLMCEGAAADWSAVDLRENAAASAGIAALGFATYSAAMTVGRLSGDRLVAVVLPARVLRYGGLTAAAGFILIGLGHVPATVITGWGLAGIGLSCVVPQVFRCAGYLPGGARSLALATTLGYMGLLTGPPLIGFIADRVGLSHALLIPALLGGAVALSARAVRLPDT